MQKTHRIFFVQFAQLFSLVYSAISKIAQLLLYYVFYHNLFLPKSQQYFWKNPLFSGAYSCRMPFPIQKQFLYDAQQFSTSVEPQTHLRLTLPAKRPQQELAKENHQINPRQNAQNNTDNQNNPVTPQLQFFIKFQLSLFLFCSFSHHCSPSIVPLLPPPCRHITGQVPPQRTLLHKT